MLYNNQKEKQAVVFQYVLRLLSEDDMAAFTFEMLKNPSLRQDVEQARTIIRAIRAALYTYCAPRMEE